MNKSDQNHPLWRFLNLLVVLVVVTICAFTQANSFDETEIKMIGMVLAAIGGYEYFKGKISSGDGK